MKGNEEVSAKALKTLLEKLGRNCSYAPVYPENGFPDFNFIVNGEKWAVECTDLHQYIDVDGKAASRVGSDKRLEKLCENIRAKAKPGLNRRYIIGAFGPELEVEGKEIEKRALAYIESGKTEREALDILEINDPDPEKAGLLRLVAEDQAKVHIHAVTAEVPITYFYGLDGSIKNADAEHLAADIMETLRFALNRILDDKLPKLAQCTSYDRRLLLAWLGYWVAEARQIKEVLSEMNLDRKVIDTFLLVLPNGEVHWVADPGELFT